MLKCKICEQDICEEKLGYHSLKCKDVAELKEKLSEICINMEKYAERANLMKNSLETNAVRQKRRHQKKLSRGPFFAENGSVGLNCSKDLNTSMSMSSIKNEGTESEINLSEEDVDVSSLQMSRTFSNDLNTEPIKRLSPEEYTKFIEEAKKSIFALKKVIAYANKVVNKAFEIGQLDDPDHVAYNELEIIYKQIIDTKVLEFIQEFKEYLLVYVDKKAEYVTRSKKLAQTTEDKSIEHLKNKFKANKSFKNLLTLKNGSTLTKFKEDEALPLSKDSSTSPTTKKKVLVKAPPEFASPYMNKRVINKPNGVCSPLQSPILAALSGVSTKADFTLNHKSESNTLLLQTNLNHIGQITSPKTYAKKIEDGRSLIDKIKNATNQNIIKIDLNERSDQKSTSSHLTDSYAGSPQLSSNSLNSPLKSPNLSGSYASSIAKYKETARRSRFSTNSIPISLSKALVAQTPKAENINENKLKSIEENKIKIAVPKKRSASLNVFKSFHQDENIGPSFFPSLSQNTATTPSNNRILATSIGTGSDLTSDTLKPKKKKSDDLNPWESPTMKGYYSDNNSNTKCKTKLLEPNQVSIEDFVFKKFLGRGAYGTVWLVEKKATGDSYAMKIVDSANSFTQNRMLALKAEKDIYEVLQGDFVVKAIWTFHHEHYICFVTEYMVGGDFNKIIENLGRLDKEQAQFYFAELVLAVDSLHNMGIIHRDLKPDNILMDAKGHIRLTDFGLSQKGLNILRGNGTPSGKKSAKTSPIQTPENHLNQKDPNFINKLSKTSLLVKEEKVEFKVKTNKNEGENIFDFLDDEYILLDAKKPSIKKKLSKDMPLPQDKKVRIIGTPDYMAPEVINPEKIGGKSYNERCMDWWSMGVILYEFFVGIPPFNDDTREGIFENILNLRIEWPSIGYEEDCIPPEAVDLIKGLLFPDSQKRLGVNGVNEIKKHKFFKDFEWEGVREREAPVIPCYQQEIFGKTEETLSTEEAPKNPFSEADKNKKGSRTTQITRPADFQAFRMNRVDVLHKMNQDHVKKLEKQKSTNSNPG